MEWIHERNSVVEKNAQTMLQLLYLVHVGKPEELEADHENSSYTKILDCAEEYSEPPP